MTVIKKGASGGLPAARSARADKRPMAPQQMLRVTKLGGSLLELPDLAERLEQWRASQPSKCEVMIVGGGRRVERLCELQQVHGVDDETMHWRAIDAMGENAAELAELFPAIFTRSLKELTVAVSSVLRRRAGSNSEDAETLPVIFDTGQFLRLDRGLTALPRSWDTTSDSIAAYMTTVLKFDELVLLKSTLPESEMTLTELSSSGYVDRHFATAAAGIPTIRFVDLRSDEFREVVATSRSGEGRP